MAEKLANTPYGFSEQETAVSAQEAVPGSVTAEADQKVPDKTGQKQVAVSKSGSNKKRSFEEILAARKAQMKEITERLEAGLKEYMASDEQFKKVLETMAKFHHYSANNVLLIAMQMPSATRVASYNTWQKRFNRQVMKGQHGISIIAPAPYKKKTSQAIPDPLTGKTVLGPDEKPKTKEVEITVPRYKVAKVFDLSQTTGEPLPELDVPELTGTAENYEIFMDAMRAVSPVPIRFDEIKGEAKGYYDSGNKEIVIQSGMSEVQTMKTAAHELAHARLHDRDSMREQGIMKDQKTREIEAEACAHVLLSHYHLDSSGYTIPYLASWCGSQDTSALRTSMDTIRKTAAEIFDEVEAYVAERDVDRYTIYQIDKDTPAKEYSFMRLDHARKTGIPLAMEYYRDVYHGYLRPGDTLDSLYEKFNRDDRPAANQMHSLSMSDVIVLRQGGKDKAYYVDDVGFAEIPEFLIPVQEQEQGHDRGQKSLTENTLTFYAAECMEFPVMGEVHRGLTLAEAAKALRDIPDDRMHGGKGIGFELQDGSDYAGSYPLVEAGQVMEDTINSVAYYRDHPGLQAAITEAKTYFPNPPARQERSAGEDRRTESARKEEKTPAGRKESVLAALRAHQEKARTGEKDIKSRETTRQHRKGELSL
ncbi:MAG: ImmA/IrrE family metallo-endopeptidase [Lachnospiraceae bacterium]|nr:ImmA/IrrE family metallo-endopeptidase [Lachnospiraceae bacterium]